MTAEFRIPYVNLAIQHQMLREELLAAAAEIISSGAFILGPQVEEFERRFAGLCQAKYAVGVNSGTDALWLALKALDIGRGDEAITVPNSYIATTTAIVLSGARPVFVDVGPDYNLDVDRLESARTPRTKAILPVHLTGRPADMPAIIDFAMRHGLRVIEDCAQAVGAAIDGQPVGTFGDCGCFSLHPLKTVNACGDAGIVVSNDDEMCRRLRVLRNIGHRDRDTVVEWGVNSRLDTLQAAFLLVKMRYTEEWTQRRRENAAYYRKHLADVSQVDIPAELPGRDSVHHTMVVQAGRRDALREFLADRGIGTAVHYPVPTHLQPVASGFGYGRGDFPLAEAQAERILSLPVYPELTTDELAQVVEAILSFYE